MAYSNECFELWYILHFHYWNSANPREDYHKRLTQDIGSKYQKNISLYHAIKDKQSVAIKNAKKLLSEN